MTREMNKLDWHSKWVHKEKPKERKLDEDWLVFVKELNKNLGVND